MRFCGRCRTSSYCNKQCAQADWSEHKLVCGSIRWGADADMAAAEKRGIRKDDFNAERRASSWFDGVPGACD